MNSEMWHPTGPSHVIRLHPLSETFFGLYGQSADEGSVETKLWRRTIKPLKSEQNTEDDKETHPTPENSIGRNADHDDDNSNTDSDGDSDGESDVESSSTLPDPAEEKARKMDRTNVARAIVVRVFLVCHVMVSIWRVVVSFDNNIYWLLVLSIIPMLLEGVLIIYRRGGMEHKWWSPCFLVYLLAALPTIWLLQLNQHDVFTKEKGDITLATPEIQMSTPSLNVTPIRTDITDLTRTTAATMTSNVNGVTTSVITGYPVTRLQNMTTNNTMTTAVDAVTTISSLEKVTSGITTSDNVTAGVTAGVTTSNNLTDVVTAVNNTTSNNVTQTAGFTTANNVTDVVTAVNNTTSDNVTAGVTAGVTTANDLTDVVTAVNNTTSDNVTQTAGVTTANNVTDVVTAVNNTTSDNVTAGVTAGFTTAYNVTDVVTAVDNTTSDNVTAGVTTADNVTDVVTAVNNTTSVNVTDADNVTAAGNITDTTTSSLTNTMSTTMATTLPFCNRTHVTTQPPTQHNNEDELTTSELWLIIIQESLIYLIVLGRWLLPRGHTVSREFLADLLLEFLAIASDVMEFLAVFDESEVRGSLTLTYCVLAVWSASFLQFIPLLAHKRKYFRVTNPNLTIIKRLCGDNFVEVAVTCLSIFLQDGPFLVVRMYIIISLRVITYSLAFFVLKNIVSLTLLFYRLFILCYRLPCCRSADRKTEQKQDEEEANSGRFNAGSSLPPDIQIYKC